uniref:Uncharacterized protein n=1 Tax=Arundo donax TaxID=35708 RepID=A0A0A9GN61_ARUDO
MFLQEVYQLDQQYYRKKCVLSENYGYEDRGTKSGIGGLLKALLHCNLQGNHKINKAL